jgi:hypothetical protein
MSYLVLRAYLRLIYFDLFLARRDFAAMYEKVRRYPLAGRISVGNAVGEVCSAVDMASIWYWKKVLCLQRSAATVCLLKQAGVEARLVIGAQPMPFRAHAWVEVQGRVVNDKPYMREIYAVLDQC